MTHGLALKQQVLLKKHYDLFPETAHLPPLRLSCTAEVPRGDAILQGWCSTSHQDFTRCVMRKWAFGFNVPKVPLLFRHRWEEPAGRIERIEYRDDGLWVQARVSHHAAKSMGAFSIRGDIVEMETMDWGKPTFHFVVTRAKLAEVSLVDDPCNETCVVTRRFVAPASNDLHDALIKKTTYLQEVAQYLINVNRQKDLCHASR